MKLNDMDIDLIIQALGRSYRQTGELIVRLEAEHREEQKQAQQEQAKKAIHEVK